MILAVGNIKAGVGKTLLAVNIAAALAHQGRDVLVIDGDEQGSAALFAEIRAEISDKVAPFAPFAGRRRAGRWRSRVQVPPPQPSVPFASISTSRRITAE